MRTIEQVYRWEIDRLAPQWEVDALARRLERVEERLDRRDQERIRNGMLLFWVVWAIGIAGIVALSVVAAAD